MPAENQLPAGQPSAIEQRRLEPSTARALPSETEFDYVELEERREREPLRRRRYLDEEVEPRLGGWERERDEPYPSRSYREERQERQERQPPELERLEREPIDVEPEVIDDPW